MRLRYGAAVLNLLQGLLALAGAVVGVWVAAQQSALAESLVHDAIFLGALGVAVSGGLVGGVAGLNLWLLLKPAPGPRLFLLGQVLTLLLTLTAMISAFFSGQVFSLLVISGIVTLAAFHLQTRPGPRVAVVPAPPLALIRVIAGTLGLLLLLLLIGGSVFFWRYPDAVLAYGLENRNRFLVETALDCGARIDQPRGTGAAIPPLVLAARAGDPGIFRLLLDKGADLDAGRIGDEALREAVLNGRLEVVQLITTRQAEPTDFYSYVPLAAARRHRAVVEFLVEHGYPVDSVLPGTGETALIAVATDPKAVPILGYLLAHGADPAARDLTGRTALELARERNNSEAIALLETASGAPPQ